MRDWIILLIALISLTQGLSQNLPKEINLYTIRQLYTPIDTITTSDKTSLLINLNWMDSVIQIRKTTTIKYDLETERKFRKDSSFLPNPADTIRANKLRKSFSQNCHSYSLEKFFNDKGINDSLFTEWTVLAGNRFMDNILQTTFKKTKSFIVKKRKCQDCVFEKETIIVFRNKWNTPIHTVYYDGNYHSKYGGWPAQTENNIKIILDRYFDTVLLEEYRLDEQKIITFVSKKE